MSNIILSPKSARAVQKHGLELCVVLFKRNHHDGDGASNLAFENKIKVNQADAAINAGREYQYGLHDQIVGDALLCDNSEIKTDDDEDGE